MKHRWMLAVASVLFAWPAAAEEVRPYRVARRLRTLPMYSVYDHLAFRIEGSKVVLQGSVYEPALKARAEKAARTVKGVTAVENRIEVLPKIEGDDTLRVAVARAVYGQPVFRMAPPRGPRVHVIVKAGEVALRGVVESETERREMAKAASLVPGVLKVENELRVEKTS